MNYLDAQAAMNNGQKVKLPEWIGYWQKNSLGQIEVHTKDGDVITDSAWLNKYSGRDDWEIASGELGFDFAIRAMKNGKKVKRHVWPEGTYIWVLPAQLIKKEWVKDPVLFSVFGEEDILECLATIRLRISNGLIATGWNSIADMFENDWELVIE